MTKDNSKDFYHEWSELWTKQSKDFFKSAENNLKALFTSHSNLSTEEQFEKIQEWTEQLKQQWQAQCMTAEQKAFSGYWKSMADIFNEAGEKMLREWTERNKSSDPIKSAHELYELWLNCCHEIYQKTLKTNAYQDNYSELMNQTLRYWKDFMSKNDK